MRTYRGTLVLLLLLLALGGFVYAYEFQGPGGEVKAQAQEAVVFALNESDITTIQVRDGDKSVALAKGDADTWRLTSPTEIDADAWTVTTILWRLAALNADRLLAPKIDDPAAYGLDKPSLELRMGLAGGSTEVLYLGSENPLGTGSYARKEGSDNLYLINAALVTDLRKLATEPPVATPEPTVSPDGTGATPAPAEAPFTPLGTPVPAGTPSLLIDPTTKGQALAPALSFVPQGPKAARRFAPDGSRSKVAPRQPGRPEPHPLPRRCHRPD